MKVFLHHVYEYNKGLRHLVLYTGPVGERETIEDKLTKRGIAYIIQNIRSKSINVFFGAPACVEIIRGFTGRSLSEWTPEQDFILGIMLGYDRCQQCTRFLQRKYKQKDPAPMEPGVPCGTLCGENGQMKVLCEARRPSVRQYSKATA